MVLTAEFYCMCNWDYSWLALSRTRITSYFEVKIWSLPKHEQLTTSKKILWKRREIAPKEQFLLFSTVVFNISLTSRVQLHTCLLNAVVRIFFPQFCKSYMSRYGYLEVFNRVPWNSR